MEWRFELFMRSADCDFLQAGTDEQPGWRIHMILLHGFKKMYATHMLDYFLKDRSCSLYIKAFHVEFPIRNEYEKEIKHFNMWKTIFNSHKNILLCHYVATEAELAAQFSVISAYPQLWTEGYLCQRCSLISAWIRYPLTDSQQKATQRWGFPEANLFSVTHEFSWDRFMRIRVLPFPYRVGLAAPAGKRTEPEEVIKFKYCFIFSPRLRSFRSDEPPEKFN